GGGPYRVRVHLAGVRARHRARGARPQLDRVGHVVGGVEGWQELVVFRLRLRRAVARETRQRLLRAHPADARVHAQRTTEQIRFRDSADIWQRDAGITYGAVEYGSEIGYRRAHEIVLDVGVRIGREQVILLERGVVAAAVEHQIARRLVIGKAELEAGAVRLLA